MRHLVTFFLILSISLASTFTSIAYSQSSYNVNFKNVPIKDFLTFVSEFTGRNMIYNEADIKGTITIDSQKEMNPREVLSLFFSILKLNGLIPVESGNNIQILSEKDVPLYGESVRAGDVEGETYVTTVISLDNYNAAAVIPILNKMKSRTGYIEPVRGLNLLIIRDMGSRIRSMVNMLDELSKEAGKFKLYTLSLKSTTASRAEQQIIKFFAELTKNSLTTTIPALVSDDTTNTLIIAATDKDYERILYVVNEMDKLQSESLLIPKVYPLKNAKAEDMEKILSKLTSSLTNKDTARGGQGVQTSLTSDKATNSIIAMGDATFYARLESLISQMDKQRRQVYVEALILETSIDQGSQFGVEWFGGAQIPGVGAVIGGLSNSGGVQGLAGAVSQGTAYSPPSGFSVGVIGNIIEYGGMKFPSIGALVSAAKSLSGVNIVSNPQILTLDNEEAEVFVGENRPYVTSEKFDSNNNPIQTFDYRNVGIRLKITPQISNDDTITLAVNQEINSISPATFNASAPITLTRTTQTTVKLRDRSIMVISGLIKDDSSIVRNEVPFLARIPILGWLFKTQNKTSEKTNLMIFISTSIIDSVEDANVFLDKNTADIDKFRLKGDKIFGDEIFSTLEFDIPLIHEIDRQVDGRKQSQETVDDE